MSKKSFSLACLLLAASLCQPPIAVAGVYEDLRSAVENDHTADVAKLLAQGADPNTPDERGNTLLMVAIRHKNAKLVDLLIDAGARLNLRNKYGETAIMLASYKGLHDIVEKLYVKGAEIKHPGWNPLLYAATGGHPKIVQLLLDGGVPIDSTSDNGTTPLMMAARGNHSDTIKILLRNGANPNISNESGGTALKWAVARQHHDTAELLKNSGARE
ncbi:ankyrin repeat-containing protein [Nitrosospira lacus]|uniref:Ankyrin repeat-containing protein n=1 Tax=Nitrosospira lacus TaxID=1288494 RepID=A0A1W6SQM2_9PROT|nr:ankyrin repeat domain-containing protein [Nitrosospira lacus]ARO88089.1 ankyrin repeat-containing protein [Nitrosospira lacus]